MPAFLAMTLAVGLTTPSVSIATSAPLSLEDAFGVSVAHAEEIPEPLSVRALISKVALETGISSTTLYNLASSESTLNPDAIGDKGCSVGLVQINLCVHHTVTKEQAYDPEWSLTYAATEIKAGREDAWSACNCYSYVQANFIKNLPRMATITPNTDVPHKGMVAVFYYTDKQTGKKVKHVAYVLDDKGTIAEANKTHCLTGTRVIHSNDPFLEGYWDPTV